MTISRGAYDRAGSLRSSGREGYDSYDPHEITHNALARTLRACDIKGHNAAATEERISYIRQAINVGLVEARHLERAIRTIEHLEGQLI